MTMIKLSDIAVCVDSTCQKRCYSSLYGAVTIIASDSGKCLDYRVLFTSCNACKSWEVRKKR